MVDVEKLISAIYLRTPIWDQKSSLHHNRDLIWKHWQEIADSCGITTDVAKTKWKNLRDNFRTEWKKKIKGKSGDAGISPTEPQSNWVWFKNLLFLKDQMVSRQMSSNLSDPTAMTLSDSQIEDSQVDTENDNSEDLEHAENEKDTEDQSSISQNTPTTSTNTNNYRKRTRNSTDNELLNIEKKKIKLIESHLSSTQRSKKEDDLYYFLISLHKPLSDLPIERQMFIRIKMQELIYNEIINKNQPKQNSSTSQFGHNIYTVQNNRSATIETIENTPYQNPSSLSSVYSYSSTSNDNDLYFKNI